LETKTAQEKNCYTNQGCENHKSRLRKSNLAVTKSERKIIIRTHEMQNLTLKSIQLHSEVTALPPLFLIGMKNYKLFMSHFYYRNAK
jgi:hypothetical protein